LITGFTHRILNLSLALKEMPSNLETVLRNERLALLIVNAKRDGLDTILTGHQQDDQYETVIQRLSFGSTLAGLGGIPIESGFFVRPQLDFPKVCLSCSI
jgi:tRNA(Ile)-lysidine synthase TilS/MesJ